MFPIAYAYPKAKRAVRDLLRRRLFFVRQRAELSVHLQNTNHQYNINKPLTSSRMRSEVYRNTIPQKFTDPATLKMVNADLAMFQAYNDIITKLEFQIEDSMEVQDPVSYSIINSVPGLGFILSLTILYEIDDIHRFSDVGNFISCCWLLMCSHESAGKKEYVFDSGRFSWNLFLNCDQALLFYFERKHHFSLKKEDCLKIQP